MCFQETNFKLDYCTQIRNYTSYNKNRTNCLSASGGVAIYVKDTIYSKEIKVDTEIEAIATSIIINSVRLCICNIYLPNNRNIDEYEINKLIQQLPKPFLIVGDFNSHNSIWGSKNTDIRGKQLEKIIDNENLLLLNNDMPTHFNSANGTLIAIDLSIASCHNSNNFEWEVLEDSYDSDHFPVMITVLNYDDQEIIFKPRWKFNKAN